MRQILRQKDFQFSLEAIGYRMNFLKPLILRCRQADIRLNSFITGVVDTGDKLIGGFVVTGIADIVVTND